MNQEKIGTFIADMRKEKGLTQVQPAEKLGVNNKTVSRWETGKNIPVQYLPEGFDASAGNAYRQENLK